jgi:hypothetical protein
MSASPILASLIAANPISGRSAAFPQPGGDGGSAFEGLLGPMPEVTETAAQTCATPAPGAPQPEPASRPPSSLYTLPAWSTAAPATADPTAQTATSPVQAPAAEPAAAATSQPSAATWAQNAVFAAVSPTLGAATPNATSAASAEAAIVASAPEQTETPTANAVSPAPAASAATTGFVAPLFERAVGAETAAARLSRALTAIYDRPAKADRADTSGAQTAGVSPTAQTPAAPPATPARAAAWKPPAASAAADNTQSAETTLAAAQVTAAAATVAPPPLTPTVAAKPAGSGVSASAPAPQAPSMGLVAATDASLSAAGPAIPNASLSSAMQTIADALSGADSAPSAAQASAALAPILPSTADLRNVQSRTHLTVSGSRLFALASPRAREALDRSPATPATADTTSPPAAAPAGVAGDAAPEPGAGADDLLSSGSFSQLIASDGVGFNPLATADDSVSPVDLGDRLAAEASDLATASGDDSSTLARGAVKELQFQLEPAELGAVAVRLRLTTGGLSVDISVSNPSALVALEKQRDSMAAKLDGTAQPLESLVIQQQSGAAFHDPSPPASGSPSLPSAGDASGDGSSRRNGRDPGSRPPRATPAASASSVQNSSVGALVV